MASKPTRFWPLATIILLPVLVLAGVAWYGLKQRRIALREEAARQCQARILLHDWTDRLQQMVRDAPEVIFYDDPPVPVLAAAAGKEAAPPAVRWATKGWDDAREKTLQASELTESGLPRSVVETWQQLQPILAADTPPPDLETQLENFLSLIVVKQPSALSIPMMQRLKARYPSGVAAWQKVWKELQAKRSVSQAVSAQINENGLAVEIPYSEEEISAPPVEETLEQDYWTGRERRLMWRPSSVAVIYTNGRTDAVLLMPELRKAYEKMLEDTKSRLPEWAICNIRLVPSLPIARPIVDRRFSLGEGPGEVLSQEYFAPFVIETGPRDRDWLIRDHYRLLWWAVSLIGTALITAMIGLRIVYRTLNRERRLGELKSQFVSSVSHELRAPIGSMRLMAEGLASGRVQGTAAAEFHRLMAGEGARLSSLIENVLDFARIEQGRKEYVMAETDVAALLGECVALMQPQAEAKGLRIVLECEPLPFVPRVDAGAVQQAVINLLDNAVKFTPGVDGADRTDGTDRRTDIRVQLTAALGTAGLRGWSITVADPGAGIPAAEHARIFERFYRLGNELRRETTGTGIGLAIVKHIVEAHGGRVTVESVVGQGSTFRMEFAERLKDEV